MTLAKNIEEFINTYGWAIIVVLIAIGGLVYFDVIPTPIEGSKTYNERNCICDGCSLSFFGGDNFTPAYNKISCCYETLYYPEDDYCEFHRQESYFFIDNSTKFSKQEWS